MADVRVGLVGATGLVGSMMRSILSERKFPVGELRLFASSRSAGATIDWNDRELIIEDAKASSFKGLDIVLLSAGGAVSKELAPQMAADGAVVVDNSSAWRMDPDVPLVVSEVNPGAIAHRPKAIIANPNCTTMVAMPVLKPLHDRAGLGRVIASTYQAVSGAGTNGVRELEVQLAALAGRGNELSIGPVNNLPVADVFPRPVAQNVIALAGTLVDDETDEEHKFRNESRKILDMPDLDVTCTCVRVPVFTGHSLSLDLEFEESISPDQARALLAQSPGVCLSELPTPLAVTGTDETLVGRIRQSNGHSNRLSLFISGDNLRKGAALNAVQVAELLLNEI